MADEPRLYHFGCTFSVVKNPGTTLADMELALAVLEHMKYYLVPGPHLENRFRIVAETIHPIMVGPAGGTPLDTD